MFHQLTVLLLCIIKLKLKLLPFLTRHPERLDDETEHEIMNALDWTYDDALDYLNEIDNPAGRAWWVEDQSLFMEELDD